MFFIEVVGQWLPLSPVVHHQWIAVAVIKVNLAVVISLDNQTGRAEFNMIALVLHGIASLMVLVPFNRIRISCTSPVHEDPDNFVRVNV